MIRIALCDDDQKILDETSRCIMRYAQEKDQTNLEIVRFHSASALHFALDGDSFFDIFILKKTDPNVTLSADERELGGLGIYMVKKSMDEIVYEYKDGQNILKIKKNLQ